MSESIKCVAPADDTGGLWACGCGECRRLQRDLGYYEIDGELVNLMEGVES